MRTLEEDRERVAMRFQEIWSPVLALEAWAGATDSQRATMWRAIHDCQGEYYALSRQLAEERRERLELAEHVSRIERSRGSG